MNLPPALPGADAPQLIAAWAESYRPLGQLIDGHKTNRKLAFLVEGRVGPRESWWGSTTPAS